MALRKKGKYYYGDSRADIAPMLARYSEENAYPVERMDDLKCECGSERLGLRVDNEEGAAIQVCAACQRQTPIGDSADYLEDAELEECECVCGGAQFELATGAAFYKDSTHIRWFYVGCRCVACGLVGCYGDWKTP
ncbi:hypothetical protein KYC5002_08075 [Archangium violaceum]|uniref:hypothetical protein n=1 Tax=Archangium violaceum TaxID=83451 RepID=UPI002B2D854A|nr:hypothetical protein KYC5002_08075 [Archangium gephyra]